MKNKPPKCAICKSPYKQWRSTQKVCSTACAIALVERDNKKKAIARKREHLAAKKALKRYSWYVAKAQKAVNAYVRERDHGLPCICCGKHMSKNKYGGTIDASHYRSCGSAKHMRFCLNNIFAGCVECNKYLSGASADMRLGMIKRIGIEKVEQIENDHTDRHYTKEQLERMARIFRKKTRMLKKRREINGQ